MVEGSNWGEVAKGDEEETEYHCVIGTILLEGNKKRPAKAGLFWFTYNEAGLVARLFPIFILDRAFHVEVGDVLIFPGIFFLVPIALFLDVLKLADEGDARRIGRRDGDGRQHLSLIHI